MLTLLMGRRSVSLILSAGGLRGLLEGVCTEHTLINTIMNTNKPTRMRDAAHQ